MAIDITSVLQEFQQRQQLPQPDIADLVVQPGATGPATVIQRAIDSKTLKLDFFPFDLPPHHFTIVQGVTANGVAGLSTGVTTTNFGGFDRAFKLPMPGNIQDTHSIKYDHTFNWLNLIASGTGLGSAGGLATKILSGLGFAVNTFKAVTLVGPEFRTFQLEWRLFPKTFDESKALQRMIIALQTGMAPPKNTTTGLVFNFPKIYVMWFTTGTSGQDGSRYLFKFKPCVLQGIQVNYQGGGPVPAFYKNEEDQAVPEGIILSTSWLELELWTRQNFENSIETDELYNSDPFSAFNR